MNMIEKVALAMTAAANAYIKERHALIAKIEKDVTIIQHLGLGDVPMRVLARAAIEALRAELIALDQHFYDGYDDVMRSQSDSTPKACFKGGIDAMIDAALGEASPENQTGVRQVQDADAMRKETQELVRLFDEATK